MGRVPTEPRYRPARDTWYVQIGGRQVTLAKGKANKKAAWARFRELMAEAPSAGAGQDLPVGMIVSHYLEHLKGRRDRKELEPGSRRDAVRRMADFPDKHLTVLASELRPHHVSAWLEGHPDWGATSRHDAVGTIKACFRWAKSVGHIASDPLAELEKPKRPRRRAVVLEAGQWPKVLAAITVPAFRDFFEFLFETGARPGEAFRLEARHVDIPGGVAVLSAGEHKSGRKTGRDRAIYLSPRALEIVGRLVELHPRGPIFLNSRGNPWDKDSVNCQVRAIRKRSGLGRELIAYSLRHLFATDALDRNVPVETVAKLLGHSDSRMVSTVYSRLDERHDHFRVAVGVVRGDDPGGVGEVTPPVVPSDASKVRRR